MAVRPTKVEFSSGTEGWDAAVRDNTDAIFDGPFPLFREASLAALAANYPADEYEQCFALAQDTGSLYLSDGVVWQPSVAGPGLVEDIVGWGFRSSATASGTYYCAGHYLFGATDNDFSPALLNFGTANSSHASHVFVVLGAVAVDEITITVTGTSITDEGVRTTTDTDTIVIPDTTGVDTYFETSKKFIGDVDIATTAGTPKTCNYGFCKYWDNFNRDFLVIAREATWLSGANDSTADLKLLHHKATGWTFNSGAEPTPPTPVASLQGSHVTEHELSAGECGAWKVTGLSETVVGSGSEGIIIEIIAGANRSFELGNFSMVIDH
jgi:hypothetical protein